MTSIDVFFIIYRTVSKRIFHQSIQPSTAAADKLIGQSIRIRMKSRFANFSVRVIYNYCYTNKNLLTVCLGMSVCVCDKCDDRQQPNILS